MTSPEGQEPKSPERQKFSGGRRAVGRGVVSEELARLHEEARSNGFVVIEWKNRDGFTSALVTQEQLDERNKKGLNRVLFGDILGFGDTRETAVSDALQLWRDLWKKRCEEIGVPFIGEIPSSEGLDFIE